MIDDELPASSSLDPASALCTACGLCCDGTLFARVRVRADEEERIAARGLAIAPRGEKRYFEQPCPRLEQGCCTIYADRPLSCTRYRCRLLLALDGGEVALPEALAKVTEAKRLIEATRPGWASGENANAARSRWLASPASAWLATGDPGAIRFHFAMMVVTLYLDRNFRLERHRMIVETGAAGALAESRAEQDEPGATRSDSAG